MSAKPKPLHVYTCQITSYVGAGMLSYSIDYAEITAESKAEAAQIAAASVEYFRTCKAELKSGAQPGDSKGIKWLEPYKSAQEEMQK